MSFKKHVIRRVIPTYFMIVTFINIGMLTAGLTFFKEVYDCINVVLEG